VTGRGAYELIARRFKMLKQTASILKSSVDEVPQKVQTLEEELAEARKQIAALRTQQALSDFNKQLASVTTVKGTSVLAVEVANADADTLRALADVFRTKYPKNSVAVMASGSTVISVITEDLVKAGMKAGDIIGAIGGKGGGRPNMAQGSLPNGTKVDEALSKVAKAVQETLK
jgi:alanyl-tRNA synthetase